MKIKITKIICLLLVLSMLFTITSFGAYTTDMTSEVYTFEYDIDGLYPNGVATLYDAYAKDDESDFDSFSRLNAIFCGLIE